MTAILQQQHVTSPVRQNFIDWMKAVGMLVIVYGHIVGSPNHFTQPIYPKQLGVAFFVFVTAWSLANDPRPRFRVLYNRLFPLYFWGISLALFLSVLFLFVKNTANLSNYLPFFLGINVAFNYFPANPTTWYIGTYLHLLIFWLFFLRGKVVGIQHILIMLVCEISIRSILLATDKEMIAYMLLPNWGTIFLLGVMAANKRDVTNAFPLFYLMPLWLIIFALWAFVTSPFNFDVSFPFRAITSSVPFSTVVESVLVTLVYSLHTLLFFSIARRLPRLSLVQFFSRNTLIIFIAHMPVIYGGSSFVYSLFDEIIVKKTILIFFVYVGIAVVSEIIMKILNINALKERIWNGIVSKLQFNSSRFPI